MSLRDSYRRDLKGKGVLLADDVRNTGETLAKCAALVMGAGAEVVATVQIYDRLEAIVELGVPNIALAEFKAPQNYKAADCPLCAAGTPITPPPPSAPLAPRSGPPPPPPPPPREGDHALGGATRDLWLPPSRPDNPAGLPADRPRGSRSTSAAPTAGPTPEGATTREPADLLALVGRQRPRRAPARAADAPRART